jgi:putative OPT family oligopeptide transporter
MKNTHRPRRELTVFALVLGSVLAIVMCAANTYLGLYAGMTVSASIPAAVIAAAIFGGILKRDSLLECNIVQTMASAGESLAAGIIFTVPALVLVGIWTEFDFWKTTLIAITGGLIGVIFMIPLRRNLIVESKDLKYPEGVACAEVLKSSQTGGGGLQSIIMGILSGGVFKLFTTGIPILKGTVEFAARAGNRILFVGLDASPALLAVGYIIQLNIAALVFIGGFIGWNIVLPFLGTPSGMETLPASDIAWHLWSTKVRYLGVGAMITGGLWSIISVRAGIAGSIRNIFIRGNDRKESSDQTQQDLSSTAIRGIFGITVLMVLGLYFSFTKAIGMSILVTVVMVVTGFFFVAVSSFIVGLVGSSNNPVSGMTICVLLGTSALLLGLGMRGDNAILATLGVAGVVCCAACSAGDISQDLKTGYIVGATPRYQQTAQILAVIIPTFTIAPVLTLLHNAYGIGTGLKAPQATLFASITQGMFGDGSLPLDLIGMGVLLGIVIIATDLWFKGRRYKFRLHVMPVAVGIYLPLSLSVPILIGGIVHYVFTSGDHEKSSPQSKGGILLSSGLIAGEAIMGILLAVVIYFKWNPEISPASTSGLIFIQNAITVSALLGICWLIKWANDRA